MPGGGGGGEVYPVGPGFTPSVRHAPDTFPIKGKDRKVSYNSSTECSCTRASLLSHAMNASASGLSGRLRAVTM